MEAAGNEAVDTIRDYNADNELCKEFLREFVSLDSSSDEETFGSESPAKYMQQLQGIANREVRSLDVSLDDIASFSSRESVTDIEDEKISELLRQIEKNTKRYVRVFSEAVDELMPLPIPERMQGVDDVIDVLMRQVRV